jgi:hypothetical protein
MPTARLVTAAGADLGGVVLSGSDPQRLTMWIDAAEDRGRGPSTDALRFRCEAVLSDGSVHRVGTWTVTDERHSWTVGLDTGDAEVRQVRVTASDGTVLAVADLPA